METKKPAVLMILDGYGLNDKTEGNAVALAKTPVMEKLMAECPFVKGNASGMAVGLPDGQMGNSEVGHLNMGAGRIVYQELTRITKEIQDGTFFENPALLDAVNNCKEKDSSLHMFGLLSDGGVHSHNTHLYGLLELARRNGLSKVYVHAFLDGRDTPPASGKGYVEDLEAEMKKIGVGEVATVTGRYYAMDRDNNYDRVEKAYLALTKGEGLEAQSGPAGIQASYDRGETDEFVKPTVVMKDGVPTATIKDGDSVIFFNFRPDRAREITRSFCDDDFKGFAREKRLDLTYVCFSDYDPRDFLLQRRRGGTERGRDPHSGQFSQGRGDLRLKAPDERLRGMRQAGGGDQIRHLRRDHHQLREPRYGGSHRCAGGGHQGG